MRLNHFVAQEAMLMLLSFVKSVGPFRPMGLTHFPEEVFQKRLFDQRAVEMDVGSHYDYIPSL